jgi:3-phenylpropionate/trans-cinnamate dioxygenase ferredoxin component
MSEWVVVDAVDAIAQGTSTVVDVDDVMVAVFNINGDFFAVEDVCSHDGGEIASGCVKGYELECPRHGARFNIKTGEVLCAPAYEDLETFPIRIVNNTVQVRDHRWD